VSKETYVHGKRGLITFAFSRHDAARRRNELAGADAVPPAQYQYSMLGRLVKTWARLKPRKRAADSLQGDAHIYISYTCLCILVGLFFPYINKLF